LVRNQLDKTADSCLVCGHRCFDLDHIKTRGAGGSDHPTNLWPLCRKHHTMRHSMGLVTFARKFKLENELKKRGLFFNGRGWVYDMSLKAD